MDEFTDTLRHSLAESGVTIIDVPVDYSRNTELFAELHAGVFE
jgi:acetolactate synthase I/II/III large subunit